MCGIHAVVLAVHILIYDEYLCYATSSVNITHTRPKYKLHYVCCIIVSIIWDIYYYERWQGNLGVSSVSEEASCLNKPWYSSKDLSPVTLLTPSQGFQQIYVSTHSAAV